MNDPDRAEAAAPIDRSIPGALSDLFKEVILDHYRRPRNKGPVSDATHTITMNNPLCGDVIELSLAIKDDRIEAAGYDGRGCSISQASASMMTVLLSGARLADARALSAKFTRLLHGESELEREELLGDLRALSGVSRFPVRIKCALLGFNCLEELIGEPSGEPTGQTPPEAGHEPGEAR